jgi:hypothetical protein
MSNPRPDNTWPSAHTVWYEDDDIQPRVWVPLALAMVIGIGLLVAFVMHRDEAAPVAVEVQNP